MAQVRCIYNSQLRVTLRNGKDIERVYGYGEIYNATKWEVIDKEYINIEFTDGCRINGVSNKVFENIRTPITQAEQIDKFTKVKDVPSNPDEDNDITLEGTILT